MPLSPAPLAPSLRAHSPTSKSIRLCRRPARRAGAQVRHRPRALAQAAPPAAHHAADRPAHAPVRMVGRHRRRQDHHLAVADRASAAQGRTQARLGAGAAKSQQGRVGKRNPQAHPGLSYSLLPSSIKEKWWADRGGRQHGGGRDLSRPAAAGLRTGVQQRKRGTTCSRASGRCAASGRRSTASSSTNASLQEQ